MQCNRCGSNSVENDGDNIYCYECGHIEKYVDKTEISPTTAPFVCILSIIPLINLIMYKIFSIRRKQKYKELVKSSFLLSVMFTAILMLGFILLKDYYKDSYMKNYIDKTIEYTQELAYMREVNDELALQEQTQLEIVEELSLNKRKLEEIKEVNQIIDELNSETEFRIIDYLDNITLTGTKVKQLLSDIIDIESCCIIFATNAIKEKYGDSYFIYGNIPTNMKRNSGYVDGNLCIIDNKNTISKFDFKDCSYFKCDESFDEKKTIFYIKDNALFNIEVEQIDLVTCIKICEQSIKENKK